MYDVHMHMCLIPEVNLFVFVHITLELSKAAASRVKLQ